MKIINTEKSPSSAFVAEKYVGNAISQTGGNIPQFNLTADSTGALVTKYSVTGSGVITHADVARCVNFEIIADGVAYIERSNAYADITTDKIVGHDCKVPYIPFSKSLEIKVVSASAAYLTRKLTMNILRNS